MNTYVTLDVDVIPCCPVDKYYVSEEPDASMFVVER
jgi:hypothetical protein